MFHKDFEQKDVEGVVRTHYSKVTTSNNSTLLIEPWDDLFSYGKENIIVFQTFINDCFRNLHICTDSDDIKDKKNVKFNVCPKRIVELYSLFSPPENPR